uniref:Acetylglutamate kinase n=1 Tax=Dasya naccarioides TaxID=2007180 RepID=A0A1Z1MHN7_9FLOR|nr:acetylglutamate kinase [Dasya naccarioides]ARW65254.1 acetylglutamate kinase [Dasya naccarioides]
MSQNYIFNRFSFSHDLLPFIKKYMGSTFVIKYGGSVMKNSLFKRRVINDIIFLYSLGIKIILVHGGGPFINDWLSKLNILPKFENGIRITDRTTMEIVEMVLIGKVNTSLLYLLNQNFIPAIGLSGKDSNLFIASSLFDSLDNLVGKIDSINNKILKILLSNNYIPVVASIASGVDNEAYNVNADTVAGIIAQSLHADKLILLTDTPGIMLDFHNDSTLIKKLNISDIQRFKNNGIISGGMIPKVDCCVNALYGHVKSTHIIDGSISHALLYELLTFDRIGSMIVF